MRTPLTVVVALVALVALVAGLQAQDEKTLKGTITCAKCDLKLPDAKACQTVIQVKEGGKDVTYYFDKASHKKYHSDVCKEAKKGSVTGKVSKEGDKSMVSVNKLDYDK